MLHKEMFSHLIPFANSQRLALGTYIHIAILMKGKRIIAIAKNKVGTRTQGCGYANMTIHAEIAVIKKVGDLKALKGLQLIVLRYGPQMKDWTNSKPCSHCRLILEKIMREYGLQKVYYSI